jgi:hypothetical protein
MAFKHANVFAMKPLAGLSAVPPFFRIVSIWKLRRRADVYRIFTIAVHFCRSDCNPFSICADTATMWFPDLNSRRSVMNEIPFINPVAPAGAESEPKGTFLAIPSERS